MACDEQGSPFLCSTEKELCIVVHCCEQCCALRIKRCFEADKESFQVWKEKGRKKKKEDVQVVETHR